MSEHTFNIPADLWMSANDRRHWADKARRTKQLRIIGQHSGVGPQSTTHVAAFIGYPHNGKADPANAAPTVKALIDGMVDAGVWPDDDSTYVIGPTYLRDKASGQAGVHTVRLVLTPQEVPVDMTDACNHMKYDNPDDCMPMVCTRQAGHEGDHRPTSHCSEVWATWPNEEGGDAA